MASRRRLRVDGIVQGVGFRPFVYRLARSEGLSGFVSNTSAGVFVEIQGPHEALDRFTERLGDEAPPLARIMGVTAQDCAAVGDETAFEIRLSENSPGTATLIPPDIAVCADCLREIRDPGDRRFGYPFTNCTNCGPRWTIIDRIPYDRPYTSMARFAMCPECLAEYGNPEDRRFHAQPNACPRCGPRLWLAGASGDEIEGAPLPGAAERLARGEIVAVKGLGGFHLAVRADDQEAVARLRRRKLREAKPLAVMAARDALPAEFPGATELASPEAPIVLVERSILADGPLRDLAPSVAAGHRRLGVMLPYTPLHHLLLDAVAAHGIAALVMTSGNASEEPICLDNDEALRALRDIADCWLLHDRDILRRADDSVIEVLDDGPLFFRRGRGHAPVPILLAGPETGGPPVLAVGPEMKNTVCLLKEDRGFLGPHIGDLENLKAYEFFTASIDHLQRVLECEPGVIAHDLHPGYFSTRWAHEQAAERDVRTIGVQHHHAHLVAVQAELGLAGEAVGLILDGTGYGPDGTIWGGELLVGDANGFERHGHLQRFRLPGGDAAVRAPWRTAVAALHLAYGPDPAAWPDLPFLGDHDTAPILAMLERDLNCPVTSSCGRLFDAAAALTGRWGEVHYEAQAAIEWMALTTAAEVDATAPWRLDPTGAGTVEDPVVLPVAAIVRACCDDLAGGVPENELSARFHATLIDLLARAAQLVCRETGLDDVVLGGGVFQNGILTRGVGAALARTGLRAHRPLHLPPGDGALSLGQAVIARARLR